MHLNSESASGAIEPWTSSVFHPSCLKCASVLEMLQEAGFEWLSHFSSVDPLHDVYGIEVCGISDKDDARKILKLLRNMFPDWREYGLCYKDYGMEPGWKAKVHRDHEPDTEQWQTA